MRKVFFGNEKEKFNSIIDRKISLRDYPFVIREKNIKDVMYLVLGPIDQNFRLFQLSGCGKGSYVHRASIANPDYYEYVDETVTIVINPR